MNALEYRALTAACMYDSRVYSMAVTTMLSISLCMSGVLNYWQTLHLNRVLVGLVLAALFASFVVIC